MTPFPNVAPFPNEIQTYPATTRSLNSATLSPPIPLLSGSNTHKKKASITSNPVQASEGRSSQEYIQTHASSSGDYTHSHMVAPDYMSGTHSLEHDFGSTAQQSFAFDELMTPEYSDNQISERTTPQEFIWEQQFLQQDSDNTHILQSTEFSSPQNPLSPSNDFNSIFSSIDQEPPKFVSGSQLLSPRLSSPGPSEPASQSSSQVQPVVSTSTMGQTARKRGGEPLQVSTNSAALAPLCSGDPPNQRPVSPSVVITSHTRGDSPARPSFLRARSSSKRGRQSGLHHGFDSENPIAPSRSPHLSPVDNTPSRLMPPSAYDTAIYDGDSQDRAGIGPGKRGTEQVATVNELAEQRIINEKNAEVEDWLSKSETGSAADESDTAGRRSRGRLDRPRAQSTGIPTDAMGLPIYSDRNIPGPGVLVDEDTQDEYSEDDSASVTGSEDPAAAPESPPVSENNLDATETSHFPPLEDDNMPPEQQEPLPKQFFKRSPWQDPVRGPITSDARDQPISSNAAAVKYNQEAAKWETASRAATWGTRRRLSESEVSAIVDGSRVRQLSLAKRGRERGSTLLNKARGLIPRRSNSNVKKGKDSPPKDKTPDVTDLSRMDSTDSLRPVSRIPSVGRSKSPKSPPLDTSGAFMAMTGNLTAVGQGLTSAAEPSVAISEGLRSPLQMLKKVRSKSDVGKSPSKSGPGLTELITRYGGPPMPTLASPAQNPRQMMPSPQMIDADAVDDDDDDMLDEAGIRMDFRIRAENIIPNYEGFKIHARQLNPRLEPYLNDRVGQEQVRRYKKLIDNKIKHTKAVQITQSCASGKHCFGLGGEATMLPPRASAKDPDATCAQFQITNHAEEDIDESSFEEGVVTPALFPPGIPLPPVKRLPAEFECILCFKVKKFQKPSDWTKHVHEDIQPFSCTFPNCNEPKSFKRKADWVRHENERHRRLEYWKCDVQECSHICYRKDNFVQHLVREHKKTEPKVKSRGSSSSKNRPVQSNGWASEDNEVWRLVETCRFETSSKPRDEPCRFCGNICSSWKKLSVHMGKHMEQIAMPVLELVNLREVAPDTVISPIEQSYQQSTGAPVPAPVNHLDHQPTLSPYTHSAHSYQNSSAGQSPVAVQPSMKYGLGPGYYGSHDVSTSTHGPMISSKAYPNTSMYTTQTAYATSGMPASNHFGSINTQLGDPYAMHAVQTLASAHGMQAAIPRSQRMSNGYHTNVTTTSAHAAYNSQQIQYTSSPEMSPYHPYSATGDQGHGFGDAAGPVVSDQRYDVGSHPGQNGYLYSGHAAGTSGFQYS